MGCLKLKYYDQENALEVNSNFFGEALEKKECSDFFRLKAYTYGFNGQERDDEMKGSGNSYDFGARMYDPRIGRFFSTDRYESKFAFKSPYSYADNSPIVSIDANGDSSVVVVSGVGREVKSEQTGRISIMYDVQVYENMTAAQYQQHKTDGTLPEPSYTTQLARDAHDTKQTKRNADGSIARDANGKRLYTTVVHSEKRYGKNNETPPGTYFLFKKGTNGDYSSGAYDLYFGDKNGSRVINGPDGVREGVAIHQYDPNDSQGCLTGCQGSSKTPVNNLMDAIPDLNDDTQPVQIILEERSVKKGSFKNPENGTKYTGTTGGS